MAKKSSIKIGPRDIDILTALSLPLTAAQLLRLSKTFCRPFTAGHDVRRRLRQLAAADLVRGRPYSSCSNGRSPNYFKLTRLGYRTLHGIDVQLPKRRYFEAMAPAHHHHTNSLSEFVVHASCLAHEHGWVIRELARENSVRFDAQGMTLFPDACFQIATPERTVNFIVELDNGTERVRTERDVESIQRKVRGYDLHASQFQVGHPSRYFVLFVTTRSQSRVQNIVSVTRDTMQNPDRSLFLTTNLDQFLSTNNLLNDRVFLDNNGRRRSMVRDIVASPKKVGSFVTATPALC
ncbi:replication-relaxation family protein [bacterium]|nr:replication-relaxation family protein [bacterium]